MQDKRTIRLFKLQDLYKLNYKTEEQFKELSKKQQESFLDALEVKIGEIVDEKIKIQQSKFNYDDIKQEQEDYWRNGEVL